MTGLALCADPPRSSTMARSSRPVTTRPARSSCDTLHLDRRVRSSSWCQSMSGLMTALIQPHTDLLGPAEVGREPRSAPVEGPSTISQEGLIVTNERRLISKRRTSAAVGTVALDLLFTQPAVERPLRLQHAEGVLLYRPTTTLLRDLTVHLPPPSVQLISLRQTPIGVSAMPSGA